MSRERCFYCGFVGYDDALTRRHELKCPLANTCERCGALRQERCRGPNGFHRFPHRVRGDLVKVQAAYRGQK